MFLGTMLVTEKDPSYIKTNGQLQNSEFKNSRIQEFKNPDHCSAVQVVFRVCGLGAQKQNKENLNRRK
jgi:hypothetical protein